MKFKLPKGYKVVKRCGNCGFHLQRPGMYRTIYVCRYVEKIYNQYIPFFEYPRVDGISGVCPNYEKEKVTIE
jgi:hypothetical protein